MARKVNRRLKVFAAQFGFHESVVAAPSQAAALEAWGVHQNLFASGHAKVTEDADAIAAAKAHPGVPLRRPVGSTSPYRLTAGAPKVEDEPRSRGRAKPRPPADRRALGAAEAALATLAAEQDEAMADLDRRRQALDREVAAAEQAHAKARKSAEAAVAKARAGYRKAGGRA